MGDIVATDEELEETRNFNAMVAAFMAEVPDFATAEGLEKLRANDGFFASAEVAGVIERDVPGGDGPVPARLFVPERVEAVYLNLHGGGWCIGSAQSSDAEMAALAEAANVAVISIDYRLAPEHPFPAGPDDCEAVARWLLDDAVAEFGTDRLFIGGASAGAHLAALTLLRVRDRLGQDAVDRFIGANLIFGAYDLGMTPSQRTAVDGLVIPLPTLEACYANALPGVDREGRRDPAWSPLYANLTGLPPALFTVGTADPLYDDSLFMAARWAAAGNEATLEVSPECVHGFVAFPTTLGRRARDRAQGWVAAAVAQAVASATV
jgi:acetyl esterase